MGICTSINGVNLQEMDPIDEQFCFCILCYMIIRLGTRQKSLCTRDWLCRSPQSSAYATLLQELDRNEYKNYLHWFFRISHQMSMCICLHLPMVILSVDSDSSWLISIKVVQSLTGNRNNFYLHQSWSNFDQVRQSGVYTIKVSKSKSIKVTWSNLCKQALSSIELVHHQDRSKYEPRHDKTQQNECAPSEDSDQPGHLPNLIRVSTEHSVGS